MLHIPSLRALTLALLAGALTVSLTAQQMQPTPNRRAGEGDGPYDRLVIRGATIIDGTGAPPRGPVDLVITQDRITEISSVGFPKVPIGERGRPAKGTKEIDATGMYVMPGFVDLHVHCGGGQANDPEYVYKLWLAHGVTTVRGVPCGSMDWDLQQRELVGQEPDRRAAHLLLSPSLYRRGLGPLAAADARERARVGALCRQEGHRRPEAGRLRSRDHGGAARRGQEARPGIDGAPRSDGRRPHERAAGVTARALAR